MASRLPPSVGAQNEWMTSAEVMDSCTGRPSGRCSSLAVTSPSSGYWNSHHHWWPITSTFSASAGASPADALKVDVIGHQRSEEHTSELQSRLHLVCRLLLEKKKNIHRPAPV